MPEPRSRTWVCSPKEGTGSPRVSPAVLNHYTNPGFLSEVTPQLVSLTQSVVHFENYETASKMASPWRARTTGCLGNVNMTEVEEGAMLKIGR